MKFVVSSNTLLTRLQAVSKVIGGKPVQPILDNILLVATEGVLYATASDKETTMEARIELESLEEEGKITIPAKILLDILKEFPEQPLTFEINTETNEVKIISEKGEFSVPGESAEDYPIQAALNDSSNDLTSKCGLILEGIVKTIFATANDDLRPVMNCILIEMNEDNFTFVASDAHKLVRYKRFDAKSENGQFSLILPKKPALMLKNILPKDDSELKISFNDKMACFVFGDYKMTSTLVEGRFPNYNSVIPQNNPKKIIIEKNAQSISMTKILGYTNGEISRLYIMSTMVVVVIELLLSLPIETVVMNVIFRVMMMESLTGWITLWIDPKIYVEMFLVGFITYVAVALLEYRKIKKVPMDEALKNVE